MNKKHRYKTIPVYIKANDAEYIREKLGREPVSKDLVEALLKYLSTL